MDFSSLLSELEVLRNCNLCPRECHTNRFSSNPGYCKSGAGFNISSICIHRGEEPVISGSKGICNIFFTHCNLQCSFCQNHQISSNQVNNTPFELSLEAVTGQVIQILDQGINIVGFVSPSHMITQMKAIIRAVESQGYKPTWVYNTNGYDKVESIRDLESVIDVYLPDLKYMDADLSKRLSDAPDYPEVAGAALKEMLRQKGTTLRINDNGYAESGLLIRHLVLPGYTQNSIDVLKFIAEELSSLVHVGLMSQYYPSGRTQPNGNLSRSLTKKEYNRVVHEMGELGITRGFIQKLESFNHYQPDFDKKHPFEQD